jgi:hypothetical protein
MVRMVDRPVCRPDDHRERNPSQGVIFVPGTAGVGPKEDVAAQRERVFDVFRRRREKDRLEAAK